MQTLKLLGAVYKYLDVGVFLAWKLTGRMVTTWPSANPMGLLNMEDLRWDDDIMSVVGEFTKITSG